MDTFPSFDPKATMVLSGEIAEQFKHPMLSLKVIFSSGLYRLNLIAVPSQEVVIN